MAVEIGQFLPQPGGGFNPAPRSTRQEFLGYPASRIMTKEQAAWGSKTLPPSRLKVAADNCEQKLQRLAREYQQLQQRMVQCQKMEYALRVELDRLNAFQLARASRP
jgi:hypothetical protein